MPADGSKDEPSFERVVQELNRLKEGLRLLGLGQCSTCGRYLLSEHGKNLFEAAGELVCFNCIEEAWQRRSPDFSVPERQAIEQKLLRWLVAHHEAKVIRQAAKMPRPETVKLKIVVACGECNGTGRSPSGGACSYCEARGSEWVVVLRPESI